MLILTVFFMSISTVIGTNAFNGYDGIVFNSKNGTSLTVLKMGQEVYVVFPYDFVHDRFDGYVYYNIVENDKKISQSQNFTANEIPKTFKFSYAPKEAGIFPITKGAMSHTGIWGGEQSQSFIVVREFSKAMKFNGQCQKPFPEFTLIIKPDFSTGACVKMDTHSKLKERGWH